MDALLREYLPILIFLGDRDRVGIGHRHNLLYRCQAEARHRKSVAL